MSRFVQRSVIIATCLMGAVLASGTAQADAARASGLPCAGSAWASERLACRHPRMAVRRVRPYRPLVAEARVPVLDPALYGASRYVSLLILGVGY